MWKLKIVDNMSKQLNKQLFIKLKYKKYDINNNGINKNTLKKYILSQKNSTRFRKISKLARVVQKN